MNRDPQRNNDKRKICANGDSLKRDTERHVERTQPAREEWCETSYMLTQMVVQRGHETHLCTYTTKSFNIPVTRTTAQRDNRSLNAQRWNAEAVQRDVPTCGKAGLEWAAEIDVAREVAVHCIVVNVGRGALEIDVASAVHVDEEALGVSCHSRTFGRVGRVGLVGRDLRLGPRPFRVVEGTTRIGNEFTEKAFCFGVQYDTIQPSNSTVPKTDILRSSRDLS